MKKKSGVVKAIAVVTFIAAIIAGISVGVLMGTPAEYSWQGTVFNGSAFLVVAGAGIGQALILFVIAWHLEYQERMIELLGGEFVISAGDSVAAAQEASRKAREEAAAKKD